MTETSCVFCKIAVGEIPATMIAQNDRAAAFLDAQPLAPGHTLVVPKTHADKLADLPPEEVAPLFALVQQVARRLEEKLHPDGLTIGINQGIGQGVPHLHVHVIPRWHADGGGSIHTIVANPPTESVEDIAKKLTA